MRQTACVICPNANCRELSIGGNGRREGVWVTGFMAQLTVGVVAPAESGAAYRNRACVPLSRTQRNKSFGAADLNRPVPRLFGSVAELATRIPTPAEKGAIGTDAARVGAACTNGEEGMGNVKQFWAGTVAAGGKREEACRAEKTLETDWDVDHCARFANPTGEITRVEPLC